MKSWPCLTILFLASVAAAQGTAPVVDSVAIKAARDKGVAFLRAAQDDDGTWSGADSTGISGLAAYSLMVSGVPADDPAVAKTLRRLVSLQQPDGRICTPNSRIPGYETAIALMVLAKANNAGTYKDQLALAEKFVRGLQLDESRNLAESDAQYGGVGYGPEGGRGDLSNTAFFLEALEAAGASSNDPAVQKAKAFVMRCQATEGNLSLIPEGTAADVGAFAYNPIAAAEGGAAGRGGGGRGGNQAPSVYGSMSYAGLKSMLYAGLTPEDPRVAEAVRWIKQNYTVTENPRMGNNGLFYYYQLFAKALEQLGQNEIVDAQGVAHNWRKELAAQLVSKQQANGSWMNTSRQWQEGDPNLATAFALIALSRCEK